MSLINCPECGKQISNQASACIHCGFPIEKLNTVSTTSVEVQECGGKGYSLELINHGGKKVQIASTLKNISNISSTEGLARMATMPCYLCKNEKEKIIAPLLQKLETLPVEYKLYLDGKLKVHKQVDIIENNDQFTTTTSKIICPKCSASLPPTSRRCTQCGFDEISAHLAQVEREAQGLDKTKQAVPQMNTKQDMKEETKYIPKCPTCGSTRVEKISVAARAVSFAAFGIASNTARSQMFCKDCGYKF